MPVFDDLIRDLRRLGRSIEQVPPGPEPIPEALSPSAPDEPVQTGDKAMEGGRPIIKGPTRQIFSSETTNRTQDGYIEMGECDALHIEAVGTGTGAVCTITVKGGSVGIFSDLPDPRHVTTLATGNNSYDVACGAGKAQLSTSGISGTWNIWATPYKGQVADPAVLTVDLSTTSPASATTTAGTAYVGIGQYRSMLIYANIQGGTGGTLDIYLQVSPDGGTTWVDYAHYAQFGDGASAIQRVWMVAKDAQQTTLQTVGSGTSPALSGTAIIGGEWGDRIRTVMTAGTGTSAGKSQTIKLVLTR